MRSPEKRLLAFYEKITSRTYPFAKCSGNVGKCKAETTDDRELCLLVVTLATGLSHSSEAGPTGARSRGSPGVLAHRPRRVLLGLPAGRLQHRASLRLELGGRAPLCSPRHTLALRALIALVYLAVKIVIRISCCKIRDNLLSAEPQVYFCVTSRDISYTAVKQRGMVVKPLRGNNAPVSIRTPGDLAPQSASAAALVLPLCLSTLDSPGAVAGFRLFPQ